MKKLNNVDYLFEYVFIGILIIPIICGILSLIPVSNDYTVLQNKYYVTEIRFIHSYTECSYRYISTENKYEYVCESESDLIAVSQHKGYYPELIVYPDKPETNRHYNRERKLIYYYHVYDVEESDVVKT